MVTKYEPEFQCQRFCFLMRILVPSDSCKDRSCVVILYPILWWYVVEKLMAGSITCNTQRRNSSTTRSRWLESPRRPIKKGENVVTVLWFPFCYFEIFYSTTVWIIIFRPPTTPSHYILNHFQESFKSTREYFKLH